MKKFIGVITSNISVYIYGIFFFFVVWHLISLTQQGYGNLIFPSPIETFKSLGTILSGSYIYKSFLYTFLKTLVSFLIALIFALLLGSLAGQFKKLEIFLKPIIIVLKSAPTAAFVFLFLVLAGIKNTPIYISLLISFPILYESTVSGIRNINPQINETVKIDVGRSFISLFSVKVPLALPYIIVGLSNSFALSFKTSIMAEIIAGDTSYGLGAAINAYRSNDPTNMAPIFAIAFIAILTVIIFDIASYFTKKKMQNYISTF